MPIYNNVTDTADLLKEDYSGLTDFDALKIAVEIEKVNTLRFAYGIQEGDNNPSYLEAIAIALGINHPISMAAAVDQVASSLRNLNKD